MLAVKALRRWAPLAWTFEACQAALGRRTSPGWSHMHWTALVLPSLHQLLPVGSLHGLGMAG